MTQSHVMLALVLALGVLLPKMLPAALISGKTSGRWALFFEMLAPATLASLTALTAFRHPVFEIRTDVLVGIALGASISLLLRARRMRRKVEPT